MEFEIYTLFNKQFFPLPKFGYSQSVKNGLTYVFLEFGYSQKERINITVGFRMTFRNMAFI